MLRWMFLTGLLSLAACVGQTAAADAPALYVEAYTDRLSYLSGEEVALHVSTSAGKYAVEVARLGAKRDVVWSKQELPGTAYPVPDDASAQGCCWPVALKLPIPADWKTGYYAVRLSVTDRGGEFTQRNRRTAEGEAFFVVRSAQPGTNAKILLQLATNTYTAYDNWGGYSVYAFHGHERVQGRRVSFLRPPASQFATWELPFVQWAESAGYALDYAVNSDLEFHPELLKHYRLVLSVGHDEYWSSPMRDHLEAFIAARGNVTFFSGNTCCWQIRSEDHGTAFGCWKQAWKDDPFSKQGNLKLLSSLWSHHLVGRPENQLTGVGFLFGGYHRSHGQLSALHMTTSQSSPPLCYTLRVLPQLGYLIP
ncbi:MAG TPA: N,N-dimethylformamidase beta subunit family domain-containing protein [Pirellulales bacterium]|jgi:hypothetical protein|nr:N,N-dimethylformamidase beta subunit family domain-containing protein [Pirellulales bacterium]